MKKSLLVLAVVLAALFSINAGARCFSSPTACAQEEIAKLDKNLRDVKKKDMCGEGSGLQDRTTFRSFNGQICNLSDFWAAWSLMNCPDVAPDYRKSQCFEFVKAKFPKLADKSPKSWIEFLEAGYDIEAPREPDPSDAPTSRELN